MPDTPDTLTLARLDRENQGPWEAEYSYGGEADLHRHYDTCKKNPGHTNFIPVDKFSIEDLPADYRHKDMVDYIRAVADLTVRVTVKYVSDKRPVTNHASSKPYPDSSVRGQCRMTVGTGWVECVDIQNDRVRGPCKCRECRNSFTPETNFAMIYITTVAHVVFDDLEAEHTTCDLFFDRGSTPETCSSVVTLTGVSCSPHDVITDACCLECYTHDLDVAYRLIELIEQVKEIEFKLGEKWPKVKMLNHRTDVNDKQPLFFIVSYPHGCSKQISIGHLEKAYMFHEGIESLIYSTAMCPGSSGARVCDLQNCQMWVKSIPSLPVSHCRTSDVQPGYNYCKATGDINRENTQTSAMPDTPDTLTLARLDRENQGTWEIEYSYGGEADLHRHYDSCYKNPSHKNFIPVDKFSIQDLPEDYRDNDVVDYIRAVSDLTVRVLVKYVSDRRPATVPGCCQPFPGYTFRGQRRMTVGTGWVNSVRVCSDYPGETCTCKDCQNSSTPKTHFAVISINTGAHIVFDDTEGKHTTCHLFFDRGSTPDTCSGVVTLNGMSNIQTQLTNDWCDMMHFTHNLDLSHRLEEKLKQVSKLRDTIFMKTLTFCRIKQRDDVKDKHPWTFIVSHPHGCSKQVSLGHWLGMEAGKEENIIWHLYTTPTCPGSSGALVYIPQVFTPPPVDVTFTSRYDDAAFFSFRAAHCGTAGHITMEHGINYCKADPDIPYLQMLPLQIPQTDTGTTEENCCCVKDEDENQDLAACKKNPGPGSFFPIGKLSLDNPRPIPCRDDIMELIKQSDLTVRVSVKYVSEERPATVPGTDILYPWFSNRDRNLKNIGIGWIDSIEEYPNVACSCQECEHSKTPATSFAHLSIETYTHDVYDDLECQQNTRHLFMDVGESSNVYTGYVTLVDVSDVHHDNAKPTRRLKYSTHNLQLASRMKNLTQKQNHYIISLTRNKEDRNRSGVQQNGGGNNKYEPLFNMATRTGRSVKEVRISCYGNTGDANVQGKLYPCTLINVLGFSEARVIVLGMESTHPGHK